MANCFTNLQTQIHIKQLLCSPIFSHLSFHSLYVFLLLSLCLTHTPTHAAKPNRFPLKLLPVQTDTVQMCQGQQRQGHGRQTGVCLQESVFGSV